MVTQHTILLVEMLLLGSVLMIITLITFVNVTNLALEPVSQNSYP